MGIDIGTRRSRLAEKVGENDRDGPVRENPREEFERAVEVRAAVLWLVEKDFADDAQDMFTTFAWWDKLLDAFAEEDEPDLVVVANGGKGEHRRDFGGQLALGL